MKVSTDSLRQIYSYYSYLSKDQVPIQREILCNSLIAETIRIGLTKLSYHDGKFQPVHILSIRNWTLKKLRSLLPEIESDKGDLFASILKNGPGPSLLFQGDILQLKNGYYLPAPTRLIKIIDNNWLIISGLPIKNFVLQKYSVSVSGIPRYLEFSSDSDEGINGYSVQSIDSYIGLPEIENSVNNFLDYVLNYGTVYIWTPQPGMEAYTGMPVEKSYGYDFWGPKPLEVGHHNAILSFWRIPIEWNRYEYWLRVVKKTKKNKKLDGISEGKPITGENQDYDNMIKIYSRQFKMVCNALDALAEHTRKMIIEIDIDGTAECSINFSPPEPIMRTINSLGGEWDGYYDGSLHWILPNDSLKEYNYIFQFYHIDLEITYLE